MQTIERTTGSAQPIRVEGGKHLGREETDGEGSNGESGDGKDSF